MLQLLIIRHAQSANNALADQSTREADPPLTPLGHQQAAQLAAYLRSGDERDLQVDLGSGYSEPVPNNGFGITHLYCSAMHRALLTTHPVAEAIGVQPRVWLDIHEEGGIYLDEAHGKMGKPGKSRPQITADFPSYALPDELSESGWWGEHRGYETTEAAFERARRVAQHLRARAESDDVIALITHGTFIDRLLKVLLDIPTNARFYYLHYNVAITRLQFLDREHILLRYLNRIDHLVPHLMS